MKKALALATVLATLGAGTVMASSSGSPAPRVHHLGMKLVPGNGFYLDNDPSGDSGGDAFGSSGELRRRGEPIGHYSSACTNAPPVGAQCQVTLILEPGGRVQLAGNYRLASPHNILSVVGGTAQFRGAGGVVRLRSLNPEGSIQKLHLRIAR